MKREGFGAIFAILILSGCATVDRQCHYWSNGELGRLTICGRAGPVVYGGSVKNLMMITDPQVRRFWYGPIGIPIIMVDTILSLAADTVLLPLTIPQQISLTRDDR